MKVKCVGQMTLVDDVTRFFELKKAGQCPECNAGIQFISGKRTLESKCAPDCPNNIKVEVPRVITYDRKLANAKVDLEKATDAVLRAKFDYLFQYSTEKQIDGLKTDYIKAKQNFNDISSIYANLTRSPDLRADYKILKESNGRGKKRDWCPRHLRFSETESRVQHLKYKGATDILEMMPYTWSELEIAE